MKKTLKMNRGKGEFTAVLHQSADTTGYSPLIVCLHGFPDNIHTYDALIPGLLEQGYRVLTPVMRGYEPSSVQADRNYSVIQLAEDILAWLDHLGEQRVFLAGHDWGAVTGWTLIALAPERFHAFASLAIPHLGAFLPGIRDIPSQVFYSWYMSFFQLRGLADWVMRQRDWALVRLLWRRWSPGWAVPDSVMASVLATLSQPGVASASLGYYRSMYQLWSTESRQALALTRKPVKVPVLALGGLDDGCISPAMFEHCMAKVLLPGFVESRQLPDLGHFLHLEKPDVISDRILSFFYRWRVTGDAVAQ